MKPMRIMIGLSFALLLLLQLCCVSGEKAPTEAGGAASPTGGFPIIALPNSAVIVAGHNRVAAYNPEGKPMWSFTLPGNDTIAAPPAGALSSTTYLRGAQAIYALAPDGKLVWQAKHSDGSAAVKGIVALADSSVAVTSGDNSLVGYAPTGQPRWTFTLPDGDRLTAPPAMAANGLIYLRGGKKLYAVDSQGGLSWQTDLTQTGENQ